MSLFLFRESKAEAIRREIMEAKEQGRKEQEEVETQIKKASVGGSGLRINQDRGGRSSERGNSSSVRSKSLTSGDGSGRGGRRDSIENIASVKERIETYMNMAAAEPPPPPPPPTMPQQPTSPPQANRPKSILVSSR